MLNKEVPFLRICVSLCLGIIAARLLNPSMPVCIALTILSSLTLLLTLLFNLRPTNIFPGLSLGLSLFSVGMLLFVLKKENPSSLKEEPSVLEGVVRDFPEEKEHSVMVTIRLKKNLSSNNEDQPRGSVIVYVRNDSIPLNLIPGDIVTFRCTPSIISNRGNPYEFDYRFYMLSQGIKYSSFALRGDIMQIVPPDRRSIRESALIIRNRIIEMFRERGITGQRLALASAITLGEKSHLDRERKQYFINAGIMHIMAVSGLHAVILCYFIFGILFFLKGRFNIVRVVITLIILWTFAFITGLTPSVLRATLMFSFLQAGKILRRPVNSLNSVLASAVILILVNPMVLFDAGFLLSYSAVLYIIIFYSNLYSALKVRNRFADLIWQSAAVTITAQAGTLPLTIMLFNRFPTWFILTNVVIVPVSSLLIICGVLVPVTFPLVHLSGFIARILEFLTWLTEYLTEKAAGLPLATINNIGLALPEFIFLSVSLFLLVWYIFKKPRISFIFPVSAFLLLTLLLTIRYIHIERSSELTVYNTYNDVAIGVLHGHSLTLFTGQDSIPGEVTRHASVMGLKIHHKILTEYPIYVATEAGLMVVSQQYDSRFKVPEQARFIVYTSMRPFPDKNLYPEFPAGSEIILYGNRGLLGKKRESQAGFTCWQISRSGAYCKRL